MPQSRRSFLRSTRRASVLLAGGSLLPISARELFTWRKKVKLRFIIASDSHYGQPDTPYEAMADTFIEKANYFHASQPCDFCVLNGDIIHDEAHLMPLAKEKFDALEMTTYVTKGNHDMVTDATWQDIWKMPVNLRFTIGKNAFVLATTTDDKGTYLSPDLAWLRENLDNSRKQKNVFVFLHIPQTKWTRHAIDTPQCMDLITSYSNVKCVFHGHEHDQDGIMTFNKVPFLFDAHIGGSWGTDYRGFRVVEVLKNNSIVTYMMNPVEALGRTALQ